MLKFQEGENANFDSLMGKYHSSIVNFTYRFIGDKAEDINRFGDTTLNSR